MVVQVFRNLGLSSFYNVRFLRSGYVFMHLTSSEDMTCVWTRGVWFIGVPLRAFKWSPHFSSSVESFVVLVWVQLPDLPIQMLNKASLFSATSIIKKPIKIDEATADCSRLFVARVCVEIDLLKTKVKDFWIGIGEEKWLQKWYLRSFLNIVWIVCIWGIRLKIVMLMGRNQSLWLATKAVDGTSVSSDDSEQDIYKQKASESICSGHVEEMARGIGELNGKQVVFQASNSVDWQQILQPSVLKETHGKNVNVARREEAGYFSYSVVEASTSSRTGSKLPRGDMRVANQKLADSNAAPQIGVVEVSENQNVSRMVGVTNMSVVDPVKYRVLAKRSCRGVDMYKYVVDEDDPDYVDTGQLQRSSSLTLGQVRLLMKLFIKMFLLAMSLWVQANILLEAKQSMERKVLWERLLEVKPSLDEFWLVGGDFNVISRPNEHSARILSKPRVVWKRLDRIPLSPSWSAKDFGVQRLLSGEEDNMFSADLEHIPSVIISKENLALLAPPTMEEVKHVVWEVCEDSATRSDSFSVAFNVACWEIIKLDVYNAVLDFFQGGSFPKGMAATTIVFIPIKDNMQQWQNFSPISLCNVTNKIISKLLANRLSSFLDKIISPLQSEFIASRLISDNILLAQ
ncbi:hypothetical protein ZIOFF_031079 [Zingiber officinale]|uniref:Reverse transcriptase domain-containing protein n=1 Tax=Zingiber officinale TaxID=94328 RepID=A0A8J5HA85_ZINOF|nr:hypothetical protein ZIOFF_031079 [Zingiber officinale]